MRASAEPDGFGYAELKQLLFTVARETEVIGSRACESITIRVAVRGPGGRAVSSGSS